MILTIETLEKWVIIETIIIAAFFFLTTAGYPGWVKVALYRIQGKNYILLLTKDNTLKIKGATEEEGVYKTKSGIYELEPEDAFTFNGRRSAIWYAPYNRSVSPKVMPLLRNLKDFGVDNIAQLKYYTETQTETIKEKLGEEAAQMAETLQSYPGKILQLTEVIRITDLKNFLESRSPAAENGIIERYVGIERRKMGNPLKSSNMIIMLIMAALLGLAMGYIMGQGAAGSSTLGALSTASGSLTQLQ